MALEQALVQDPPPPPAPANDDADAVLRAALDDSILLVHFVAETDKSVDATVIDNIVTARTIYREKRALESSQETAFWQAYSALSRFCAPTSPIGIRQAQIYAQQRYRGFLLREFPFITLTIMVSLALYLMIQICVIFGDSYLKTYFPPAPSAAESTTVTTTPLPNTTVQMEWYDKSIPDDTGSPGSASLTPAEAESMSKLRAVGGSLQAWNNVFRFLAVVLSSSERPCINEWEGHECSLSDLTVEVESEATFTRTALDTIRSMVLPLLLGLIGAGAQILRSISSAIDSKSFVQNYRLRHTIRLALGAIAGSTIGLLVTRDQTEALDILQPLALPFIAGYSVEVVFSLIDRVMGDIRGYIDKEKDKVLQVEPRVPPIQK